MHMSKLRLCSWVAATAAGVFAASFAGNARAAVTAVAYYHLGEADSTLP
jgi:hypothetical protein